MTTPTAILLEDGSVVPLVRDATGLSARHDGTTFYVSTLNATPARTPATARWTDS